MKSIVGRVKPIDDNRNLKFDSGVLVGRDSVGYGQGSHSVMIRPDSFNPSSGIGVTYTWDIGRDLVEARENSSSGCTIL